MELLQYLQDAMHISCNAWKIAMHFRLEPLPDTHVYAMQKEVSDDQLYAVTDDDATIAYLLKRMREMDPDGVGIVRSEFKRFVLSRMHSGSLKQNHRLWRRLQTIMQKQGVLELDVHVVSFALHPG